MTDIAMVTVQTMLSTFDFVAGVESVEKTQQFVSPVLVDSSLFYIRTTLHGVRSGEFLTLLACLPKKSRVVSRQHEPRKHV